MSFFRAGIGVLFAIGMLVTACSSAPTDESEKSSSALAQGAGTAGGSVGSAVGSVGTATPASSSSSGATPPPSSVDAGGPPVVPPPTHCTPQECCKDPYVMPNYVCSDGTLGGPVCERRADNTCGWEVHACSPSPTPPQPSK